MIGAMPQNCTRTLSSRPMKQNSPKASQGFQSHPSVNSCAILSSDLLQCLLKIEQPQLRCSSCETLHVELSYFEQSLPVQEENHNVILMDRSPGAREVALAYLGCSLPTSLPSDPMSYFPVVLHIHILIYS